MQFVVRLSNGQISQNVDDEAVAHEYIHLLLRLTCELNSSYSCQQFASDEKKVDELVLNISECKKRLDNGRVNKSAAIAANTAALNTAALEMPASGVSPSQEMVMTAPLPPVAVQQATRDIAYAPAATLMAERWPNTYERSTVAAAAPLLQYGQRVFNDIKKKVGSNFDLLPSADAAGSDAPAIKLTKYTSQKDIPTVTAASSDGGTVAIAAKKSSREVAKGGLVVAGNQNEEADDAEVSGGSPAASGGSTSSVGGKSVKVAQSAANSRGPAAIETSSGRAATDAEIAKIITSLTGEQLLNRLNDKSFENKIATKGYRIYGRGNAGFGAPEETATQCYLIRKLDAKPSPVNCTQRSKQKSI